VRPEGFELGAYWARWEKEFAATWPTYEVVVRVGAEHLPSLPMFFGDRVRALAERTPPNADGSVTLPLTFDSLEHARSRMLGIGTAVEVVEPAELRESLAAYAREIVAFYEGSAARSPAR
jgi:hypothetical protein